MNPPEATNLSWDGVLCKCCRGAFDTRLREPVLEWRLWQPWHDFSGLKRCTGYGCRLCVLSLAVIRDASRQGGADAQVSDVEGESLAPLESQVSGLEVQAFMSEKYGVFLKLGYAYRPWITFEKLQENHNVMEPTRSSSWTTASDVTFEKIQTWLTNCRIKHATCRGWQAITNTPQGLPTRLVQIESGPGSLSPAIRLVRGMDLDTKATRYTTLSHCWGPKGVAVKLLSSNIERFSRQIPWEIVPLTFREAILAATRLGLKYIWIDALCILQDCKTDWTTEASKMTQVYTNGHINISADASPDGSGGLFRRRDASKMRSFLVPADPQDTNSQPYYCHIKNWDLYVEGAPLKRRSWVTQERFMSPRVVHFSDDQVHWECAELMTSESVAASFNVIPRTTRTPQKLLCNPDRQPDSPMDLEQLYTMWYLLVESYTEGQLTFDSDRPIAIAGLARTFAHLLELQPGDYLCGLWRPRLAEEMMWLTYTHPPTERVDPSLPSWSWLSVKGHARMQPIHVGNRQQKTVLEVVDADATVLGGDPFGPVVSGFLKVRAPLCRATILCAHGPSSEPGGGCRGRGQHSASLGQDELKRVSLRLDESAPELWGNVLRQEVYLLLGQGVGFAVPKTMHSTPSDQPSVGSTGRSAYYVSSIGGGNTAWLTRTGTSWRENLGLHGVDEYNCLVLTPARANGSFRRAGYFSVVRAMGNANKDASRGDEEIGCFDILDKHFQAFEVPSHLYEDVDDRFMYTVTLV